MTTARDHPKRAALLDELHARRAPRLQPRARVVHLALKHAHNAANRDRTADLEHLAALTGEEAMPPGTRHHVFNLSDDQGDAVVRWESHTELTAYTAVVADPQGEPFGDGVDALFPAEWEAADPAQRIAAVHVEILPMPTGPDADAECAAMLAGWLDPSSTSVIRIYDGTGVLAGDFRTDSAGFTRFVIFAAPELGPGRVGRAVQRVLDLETYRAMAMIGFLRSQELSAHLNTLDPRLLDLVSQLDDSSRPADELLHELLSVTAELEGLATRHDFRFGATAAYAAIVADRLASLGDDRFEARQTLREFLGRRYDPAIRTVVSGEARLQRMLDRAGRAGELLRTKVDVARSDQSQELLRSMDARAETQLQLQHTVEGLSVAAISYYVLGLLTHLLAPVIEERHLDEKWVIAGLVPVVVAAVWLGMRWVRSRIHRVRR